jgi:hypothetical protein
LEHLQTKEGEHAMMDEFFAAIAENREPECSAQDNLNRWRWFLARFKALKKAASWSLAKSSKTAMSCSPVSTRHKKVSN